MISVLDVTLQARDSHRNIARHYRVEIGRDLFGALLVETTNGRIGAGGRVRCQAVADEAAARALLRAVLKRRASALRRLGVPYIVHDVRGHADWASEIGPAGRPVEVP